MAQASFPDGIMLCVRVILHGSGILDGAENDPPPGLHCGGEALTVAHTGPYLIGIDAGTTGLKSLLFDLDGAVVARAYREYPLDHPHPDWAEQDPEHWWDALVATLRELFQRTGVLPTRIAGLSISSQGSTVVALGDSGVVRPAISWLDQRAAPLTSPPGMAEEDVFSITGLRFCPAWTGPIIQWLSLHEPETVRRTDRFLLVTDYLLFRLTGEIATDYSSASRTRMMDLRNRCWSGAILAAMGLPKSKLPPMAGSATVVGKVSPDAARETGLAPGTIVTLGGFDQSCCALGTGALGPDIAMISLGTATMVSVSSANPTVDPARRVTTSCHVVPDTWTLQAPIFTTGAVLRWWRDMQYSSLGDGAYEEMDRQAETAPIGADGLLLLPHFSGSGPPRWDHRCRGAFVGFRLTHTQAHIIRAILEGVAMEIRANLALIEGLGMSVAAVRIVGGGAVSATWRAIICDVLGKPCAAMRVAEVGTVGAALLAAVGAGLFRDLYEAVDRMVHPADPTEFSPINHRSYQEVYARHRDVSDRVYGPLPPSAGPDLEGKEGA